MAARYCAKATLHISPPAGSAALIADTKRVNSAVHSATHHLSLINIDSFRSIGSSPHSASRFKFFGLNHATEQSLIQH